MPGPRLPMRKIRDVLRLSAAGMSKRKIAASLGVSATAAGIFAAGSTDGALPDHTSVGETDAFLAKYNARGAQLWTTQFGTNDVHYPLLG